MLFLYFVHDWMTRQNKYCRNIYYMILESFEIRILEFCIRAPFRNWCMICTLMSDDKRNENKVKTFRIKDLYTKPLSIFYPRL